MPTCSDATNPFFTSPVTVIVVLVGHAVSPGASSMSMHSVCRRPVAGVSPSCVRLDT